MITTATKKTELQPYMQPRLDGRFDCVFYVKNGVKSIPVVQCIDDIETATAFIEDKKCKMLLSKIRSWHNQQEYIHFHISQTEHMALKPRLQMLDKGIAKLEKKTLSHAYLKQVLEDHLITMLDVCKPKNGSKTRMSFDLLMASINKFTK